MLDQVEQPDESASYQRQGFGGNLSTSNQTRWALKPIYNSIEFYLLGRAGSERGMEGIFVVEEHLAKMHDPNHPYSDEKVVLSNAELFNDPTYGLRPELERHANYIPRSIAELELTSWQDDFHLFPSAAQVFAEAERLSKKAHEIKGTMDRASDLRSVGRGFGSHH